MFSFVFLFLAIGVWKAGAYSGPFVGKGGNVNPTRLLLSPNGATESFNENGRRHGMPRGVEFTEGLVKSLDLIPLMEALSRHCGTRRGRQSLLALVGADYMETPTEQCPNRSPLDKAEMPARSKRLMNNPGLTRSTTNPSGSRNHVTLIARNHEEAQREYEIVAEALELLKGEKYPPMYGSNSSPWDTENTAETDYDTWLDMSVEESTLEHILQAEKVIETIKSVKAWSEQEEIASNYPLIASISSRIPIEELDQIYDSIAGTVKINRVRTLTDPSGKSSFNFHLNDEKFSVVKVLRSQVEEAASEAKKSGDRKKTIEDKFSNLLEKLDATENEIRRSLFQLILGTSKEINFALDVLARLDVIMAKAAFGQVSGGIIPVVGNLGEVMVRNFVHPVLLNSRPDETSPEIVPIDLLLSNGGKRALIISGPNGGGKTAAMKSFAIAAVMCKLGIPIPCRPDEQEQNSIAHVDFFDDILVTLGDQQNLLTGDSTLMAQLNACSSVLEEIGRQNERQTSMVLFDELGSGTDASAGGAIAQAILEKLLQVEGCRIVATTHVPRLKVLSFRSEDFGCATVLLRPRLREAEGSKYPLPAYHLQYDSIGDSYALDAAARCKPSLPEDVLSRASELIMCQPQSPEHDNDKDLSYSDDLAYIDALKESLERQVNKAQSDVAAAEEYKRNMLACQQAMIGLASSYDRQFQMLEQRLEEIFNRLQSEEADDLELVGSSLAELRVNRKYTKSQAETLKEQGLKLLPEWQSLEVGDSVVIAADGEMNGLTATVASSSELSSDVVLGKDDVAVTLPSQFWGLDSLETSSQADNVIILKRSQIAVFDYESVWEDGDWNEGVYTGPVGSVNESKRKLDGLLSKIKTTAPARENDAYSKVGTTKNKFSSSRERKAAAKNKKTKQNQKKRKR